MSYFIVLVVYIHFPLSITAFCHLDNILPYCFGVWVGFCRIELAFCRIELAFAGSSWHLPDWDGICQFRVDILPDWDGILPDRVGILPVPSWHFAGSSWHLLDRVGICRIELIFCQFRVGILPDRIDMAQTPKLRFGVSQKWFESKFS